MGTVVKSLSRCVCGAVRVCPNGIAWTVVVDYIDFVFRRPLHATASVFRAGDLS